LGAYLRKVAQEAALVVAGRGRVRAERRHPSGIVPPTALESALAALHSEGSLTPRAPARQGCPPSHILRLADETQRLLDAERDERLA
jgi:hypothetical protein